MTFYGGIDTQHVMPFGTPEDVKSDVENCIVVLGEGGGYVIGFAHTLTSETPIQNLYSVLEAIERYSQP